MLEAATINETIKACIHCGICLPACPTYQVTANEGHSPRGRLYLINDALQQGIDDEAIEYLDTCLECSACETVCPSDVNYIDILEYARHDLALNNYHKGFWGFIRKLAFQFLLPNRKLLNFSRVLGRLLPLKLFTKLAPSFGAYKKIKTNHVYKTNYENAQTVSMPLGCVMDTVYNKVHWDSIEVLNTFGYDVYIPETDCCGALAYHSGETELGKQALSSTVSSLAKKPYPIVMNSAGCGAFLKNHSDLEVMDLIEALKQAPINPLHRDPGVAPMQAVYHPACHINHQQGVSDDYVDLLKQIPNLELLPLYEADLCCGSAGFYNLIENKMADQIGQRKAENISSSGAKLVLTANPGCMSQIQAHLGDEYQVMHPVTLINSCLKKPQLV